MLVEVLVAERSTTAKGIIDLISLSQGANLVQASIPYSASFGNALAQGTKVHLLPLFVQYLKSFRLHLLQAEAKAFQHA